MLDLSIIVVSWNTRPILLECLAAIQDRVRGLRIEVIVIDNASSDGSADAVAERFPSTRLVRNPMNFGFARAVNQGLRTALGRFALLLNPDALVGEGAVETLVAHMESHSDCGLAGAQLLDPDGARQHSFDNFPTLATELLNKSLLRKLDPARYPSKYQAYEAPTEVESLIGAAIIVRREAAADVGLLDEAYFLFLEETDWCLRMRRAGWKVTHVPSARVYHLQGQSKRAAPAKSRIEYLRSLYLFFRKHRGVTASLLLRGARTIRLAFDWVFALAATLFTFGRKPRQRERWVTYTGLLLWHLALCPEDVGLRPWPWPPKEPGPPLPAGTFLSTARDVAFPERLPDPSPFAVSGLLAKVQTDDAMWEVVESYRWLPQALSDPACIELVKDVRVKRVLRITVAHEGKTERFLKKTYRAGGLAGALKWRGLGPRGYWEMWMGRAIALRGISFVPPVARAELRRNSRRWESVVVVPLIDCESLDAVLGRRDLPPATRRRVVTAYGAFARRVHDAGVLQDDFDPNNVLVKATDPEVELALVDAERVKLLGRPLSRKERAWSLAKLARFRGAGATDRMRFLLAYVGGKEVFRHSIRELARDIEAAALVVFRRDWGRWRRVCLSENRNYGRWRGRQTIWYRRTTRDPDHPGVEAGEVERIASQALSSPPPREIVLEGGLRIESLEARPSADPLGRGGRALWQDLNACARAGLPVVRPVLLCERSWPLPSTLYVSWPPEVLPLKPHAPDPGHSLALLLRKLARLGLRLPTSAFIRSAHYRRKGEEIELLCGPGSVPALTSQRPRG